MLNVQREKHNPVNREDRKRKLKKKQKLKIRNRGYIDEKKYSSMAYNVGGDEIDVAAMNVYGQPPHAQHVYLPSYYQGHMTYARKFSITVSLSFFVSLISSFTPVLSIVDSILLFFI